ncbi:MAG: hypothetical protein PQ612_07690 [Rickettsiales bacterium]|nr:hypothetical protein [Pseudomonadota bacterium]MDA0966970.1 hypothetical protein [Pseudomonadota bacterium]MDG4543889.1 hypothetical protein [Rickettsiales bacterium]MDG4546035.1 hypothetical protein [Rickettsiales bacterium]MDG4548281.1 hypothetical protein [Rickettsiales bacterium]
MTKESGRTGSGNNPSLRDIHGNQGELNPYSIDNNDGWLSENNINAFLQDYRSALPPEQQQRVVIGRSQSAERQNIGGDEGDIIPDVGTVKRAFQENPEADRYLLPINKGGGHWTMAAFVKDEGNNINTVYYDSFGADGRSDTIKNVIQVELDNERDASFRPVGDIRDISAQHQTDGMSCGYRVAEAGRAIMEADNPLAISSEGIVNAFNENYPSANSNDISANGQIRLNEIAQRNGVAQQSQARGVSFDPNVKLYEYEPVSNDNLSAEEIGNSFLPAVNRSDNSRIDKSKWLSNFGVDKANRSALRNAGEVNLFDSDYEPVGAVSDLRPSVAVVEATDIKNFGDRLKEILDSKPDALREQNLASGVAPDRLLIPLNVNFEGDISKKGDHWILAEVSERSGETDGKQNIAVRYLDPAYKNGKSPNLQHTQKQLEKHFNIEGGQIEDLSNAQQPIGNEWGCGYIVCDAIEKLAKDPDDESVQQRYSHKQMDQLHDKIAGGVAKEDSRVDRSLEERMKSLNGTLKSYRSLMDDPLQSADVAKTMLGFIYDPANEKKPAGKKTGLIGRIENIFDDFNADKSSDIVYSAYSVIANTIGLLKDIFVGTAVAVLDNMDTREKIQQDIKKFEAQKDALLQKQIARQDKSLVGKNAGGLGEIEDNFRNVEIDTGTPSIAKTPASTEKERPKNPYEEMLDNNIRKAFSQIENVDSDDIGKVSPPKTPVVESEKNKVKETYDDTSDKTNIQNHGSQIKNQRNGNPLQSR